MRKIFFLMLILMFVLESHLVLASSSFELVMQTDNLRVDPGDSLKINFYFTGFSDNLIKSKLTVYSNGVIIFGNGSFDKIVFPNEMNAVTFFVQGFENIISRDFPKADLLYNVEIQKPLLLNAYVDKSNKGGDYQITGVFTYFDGDMWRTSRSILDFHVNNWFERYPWIAFGLSILSLIGLNSIYSKMKSIFTKKEKNKEE